MTHDTIIVLDYGSQYTQLITRRVREANVYCELFSWRAPAADVMALRPKGFILSGGPNKDYLSGGPGHDRLFGKTRGPHRDTIRGGGGGDEVNPIYPSYYDPFYDPFPDDSYTEFEYDPGYDDFDPFPPDEDVPPPDPPQRPKGVAWRWLLLGGGGVLLFVLLGCCGLASVFIPRPPVPPQPHNVVGVWDGTGEIQGLPHQSTLQLNPDGSFLWLGISAGQYRVVGDQLLLTHQGRTDGATIAWLYRHGEVRGRRDEGDTAWLTVALDAAAAAQFERRQQAR